MKMFSKAIISMAIVTVFCALTVFGVSAEQYKKYVITDDFTGDTGFLAPGDYDGNGAIEQEDESALKGLILTVDDTANTYTTVFQNNAAAIYSDVNGDGYVDVRDLVMLDQNSKGEFIADGVMNLNGNSAFGGKLFDVLGTGAEYEIEYSYSENTSVDVKFNGLDGLLKDSTTQNAENGVVTVTRNIKTPITDLNNSGIELQLIGEGEIQSFSVTRVNMDNEIADKATW